MAFDVDVADRVRCRFVWSERSEKSFDKKNWRLADLLVFLFDKYVLLVVFRCFSPSNAAKLFGFSFQSAPGKEKRRKISLKNSKMFLYDSIKRHRKKIFLTKRKWKKSKSSIHLEKHNNFQIKMNKSILCWRNFSWRFSTIWRRTSFVRPAL